MEKPRAGMEATRGPLSVSKETQYANATRFVDQYLATVNTPLCLMNHVAVLPFESDPLDIEERQSGLAEYLFTPPPKPSEWIWGRTIVAEVVSQQLIHAALSHTLEAEGMYVTLVPTSIDDSSRKGETVPKKGVDHCIVQMVQTEGGTALMPICGVDVTTGKNDLVRNKRKRRPALQLPIAMPAIVVPLMNLTYEGRKMRSFTQYLDDHARRQILDKGSYSPFYGLEQEDVERWKQTLRSEMMTGLAACRENLELNADHPGLAGYPYWSDVVSKIGKMEEIIDAQSRLTMV